jgi:tetratricopeptide (TPR) repeat protein
MHDEICVIGAEGANRMEDSVNDKDQLFLRLRDLKRRIEEADERVGLADQQRAIIEEMIYQPLEGSADPSQIEFLHFLGFAMAEWIKVGFLPSEFEAAADRIDSRLKANDRLSSIGEFWCWQGLFFMGRENYEEATNSFQHIREDASVFKGIRLTSLYLEAWCHVGVGDYDAADKILGELRNAVGTVGNKWYVDCLHGYFMALRHHGLTQVDLPFTLALDLNGEIAPCEEKGKAELLASDESLVELVAKVSKIVITEELEPRLRLALWQAKEEIVKNMPIMHTLEEVSQRLRSEHGDWVRRLANMGALVNAEFLYSALKAKSWGAVITEHASSVEAEIKAKLLPRLDSVLKKNGTSLESILPNKIQSGGSSLGYAEAILRRIAADPLLKSLLLSALSEDASSFLLSQLPGSLARVRELRKRPAHGDVMSASEAEEMRRLVLGSPEKPGLLRRLCEIDIPYAE